MGIIFVVYGDPPLCAGLYDSDSDSESERDKLVSVDWMNVIGISGKFTYIFPLPRAMPANMHYRLRK